MNITTIVHAYKFDVSIKEEKSAYLELKSKLEKMGLTCFEAWGGSGSYYLPKLNGATVELETSSLFNNQWITAPIAGVTDSGLRVFDWAQDYPAGNLTNKSIKRGHWLEQTPAMKEVRDNTHKCGYCGKMEPAQKGYTFCPHCIDSEYLTLDSLHLTRMTAISSDHKPRAPLSKAESEHLTPLYVAAQSGATSERARLRNAKKLADIEKDYKKAVRIAETEYNGFKWLMENGVNVDNCIYYSYTDKFSFGWRSAVSAVVVSAILDKISEFPFAYEIKCADGKKLESHND